MTNPKHTDTSRSGDLVERLRGGWNGWTTLTESEAADLIETQAREIERLREALGKIERAPAWGYPDKWETTPAEVRWIARAALAGDNHD